MNSKQIFMIVTIIVALSVVMIATPVMAQNMTGGNMTGGNMTAKSVVALTFTDNKWQNASLLKLKLILLHVGFLVALEEVRQGDLTSIQLAKKPQNAHLLKL